MYITVDKTQINNLFEMSKPMGRLSDANKQIIRDYFAGHDGETHPYEWSYTACDELGKLMEKPKPPKAQLQKAITDVFGARDPEADMAFTPKGDMVYDSEASDKENIPYGMDFDQYMRDEVLPYAPDAVIDPTVKDDDGPLQDGRTGVVGTNISFNRYFYKYEQPRDPQDIAAEILDLEDGLEDFMKEFLK